MLLHLFTGLFILKQTAGPLPDSSKKNTFDSSAYVKISGINIIGNRVTKRYIILRELNFKEGDSIRYRDLPTRFLRSKQNLLNSSLFNFVGIDTFDTRFGSTKVMIRLSERWYTWPVPIFEIADRNFNTWWETKDLSRINYGFFLNRDNFRGRKERLALIAQFGYYEQYGFAYSIPYIDKKQRQGMGMSFVWTRNHEIPYASYLNKLLYYKDHSSYARRELSAKLNYTYRQGIYNTYMLEGKYFNGYVEDTIQKLTTDYFEGNARTMEFFQVHLLSKRDCRDSKAYPLKGYYIDCDINKVGLGILKDEKVDLWYVTASAKKYFKLSDRFYLAGSVRGKISSKTGQPYYTQRGLGYGDYVRGYEYYVIDGQHYALAKTGVKYEIIKPHVAKFDFFPSEKFNTFHYALYAEVFADGAYVKDDLYGPAVNPLANQYLYGYGVGLDYVTYYDAVLRLEYSFIKSGENGFFIHLWAPI